MAKANKIKLNIMFNYNWQEKSFKDLESAIMWCKRNYKNISCINDFRTFGQPISHFDVMMAIDGVQN